MLHNKFNIYSLLMAVLLFFISQAQAGLVIPTLVNKSGKIDKVTNIKKSKDERFVAVTSDAGTITIWDMKQGRVIDKLSIAENGVKDFAMDSSSRNLYLIDKNGKLNIKAMISAGEFTQPKFQKDQTFNFVRTNADKFLLVNSKNNLLVYDKNTQSLFAQINLKSSVTAIDLAENSNKIIAATSDNKITIYKYLKNEPKLYQSQKWKTTEATATVQINNSGNGFSSLSSSGKLSYSCAKCVVFNSLDSAGDAAGGGSAGPISTTSLSGNSLTYLTADNKVVKQDIVSGKITQVSQITPVTNAHGFFQEGQFLLSDGSSGGGMNLLNVVENNTAGQMLTGGSTGWSTLSSQGRFDGSDDSFKDMAWEVNGKLLSFDQFAENFYEPGILAKMLQGNQAMISGASASIADGIELPPEVSVNILSDLKNYSAGSNINIAVSAQVDGNPDTMKKINIFHNGKALPKSSYSLKESKQEGDLGVKNWVLNLKPIEGKNKLKIEVSGWQNIAGLSEVINFDIPISDNQKPKRQFMKSIGINDYQGTKLDLNYAITDAKGILNAFASSNLTKKNTNLASLMLNKQASKKNILKLLKQTVKESNKDDMLVLFMSGHGVVVDNQWYYLPQEAKSLSDNKHIKSVGLSSRELIDALVEIPSQKMVVIIDACQSGAINDEFNDFHQRRALKGLSRDTGVHIMAATRADQLAPEFDELGHGLFTYTLLNGMKKNANGEHNADLWPKDGKLMVTELQQYGETFAPALAHKLASEHFTADGSRGTIEDNTIITPMGSSKGEDFIVFQ